MSFDSVVIGNGAIGLSIALELARRGQAVAVVGQYERPRAASAAAGAMFGCFAEASSSSLSGIGATRLSAAIAARSLWPEQLQLLDESAEGAPAVTSDGTVVILNSIGTASIDSSNFNAITAAATLHNEPLEEVDPADVPWIDPDELSRPIRAQFLPQERSIDARALLRSLGAGVAELGVDLVDAQVSTIDYVGDVARGVRLMDGTLIESAHVVVAAGVDSQRFIDQLGSAGKQIPPIFSGVGTSIVLPMAASPGPSSVVRTPNRAFACGLHLVPHQSPHVFIGATNVLARSPQTAPEIGDLLFLMECAVRQLHRGFRGSRVSSFHVGNRPVSSDGSPLVGSLGPQNVWLASGTHRDGLHLSPLVGRHIADLIGGASSEGTLMGNFEPVRAPIQEATREEVVLTTVEHTVATAVEGTWRIGVEWPPRIAAHLERAFRVAASTLHDEWTPPADVLALCTESPSALRLIRDHYRAWS